MRGNLDQILDIVFEHEGGYSDRKADRGGKTNMGITEGTLARARKAGLTSCLFPRNLTRPEATTIYIKFYWEPAHCDVMRWPLDLLHFDAAVNHGVGGAGLLLQRAINAVERYEALVVDGAVGPKTLVALQKQQDHACRFDDLLDAQLDAREAYYAAIIRKHPDQIANKNGWANRIKKLNSWVEKERL